jgi:hypothetical protein
MACTASTHLRQLLYGQAKVNRLLLALTDKVQGQSQGRPPTDARQFCQFANSFFKGK